MINLWTCQVPVCVCKRGRAVALQLFPVAPHCKAAFNHCIFVEPENWHIPPSLIANQLSYIIYNITKHEFHNDVQILRKRIHYRQTDAALYYLWTE